MRRPRSRSRRRLVCVCAGAEVEQAIRVGEQVIESLTAKRTQSQRKPIATIAAGAATHFRLPSVHHLGRALVSSRFVAARCAYTRLPAAKLLCNVDHARAGEGRVPEVIVLGTTEEEDVLHVSCSVHANGCESVPVPVWSAPFHNTNKTKHKGM